MFMMKVKKYLFLLLVLSTINTGLFAQKGITLYKTFEDYENNKGDFTEGDFTYDITVVRALNKKKYIMKFFNRDNGNNLNLNVYRCWGFKFNDNLYRINKILGTSRINGPNNQSSYTFAYTPFLVYSQGKFIFYERANDLINVRGGKRYKTKKSHIANYFYSNRLDSYMYDVPTKESAVQYKFRFTRAANRLDGTKVQHDDFYQCVIKSGFNENEYRKCAQDYNKDK